MSDNNLPASKRKIDRAKGQGQVARSPELVSEAVVLWGLFVLSVGLGSQGALVRWFSALLRACLDAGVAPRPAELALRVGALGLGPVIGVLLLMSGGALLISLVLHHLVAGGIGVSWEALQFNFERLNPVEGVKRLFNGAAWGTVGLSLLKLCLALGVLVAALPRATADLLALASAQPGAVLGLAAGRMISIGFSLAGLLAVFAVAQAFWARKRWTDDLKMSRQEAVEDTKDSEGNPHTKRRFRVAHRKLARRRAIQAVRACDVVLANPTHVAVGLRYKRGRMKAPRVMVKGADLMAQRIKDAAWDAGIPVLEQPPLARDLYATVAVGREVPTRLYRAVARVIHQLRRLPAPDKPRAVPAFGAPPAPSLRPRALA